MSAIRSSGCSIPIDMRTNDGGALAACDVLRNSSHERDVWSKQACCSMLDLLRRLRRDGAFSRAATFGDFLGRYHEKFIHLPANLGGPVSQRRRGAKRAARRLDGIRERSGNIRSAGRHGMHGPALRIVPTVRPVMECANETTEFAVSQP
jgi:hypothetical protein